CHWPLLSWSAAMSLWHRAMLLKDTTPLPQGCQMAFSSHSGGVPLRRPSLYRWRYSAAPHGSLELRRHLFLLRELVKRDFQGRYAGSLLGFAWSFVQPLWLLGLFTFVFSTVLKVRVVDAGNPGGHFAVYLFSGLLPWFAVQEGVLRSSTAITDNSVLVKKLRFPAEILVVAVVLAALLHEAISAVVFLVVLAAVGDLAWGGLPVLLVALPLQVLLTLGLGLLLGAVQVFFRDTAQLLSMLFAG